MTDAEFRCVREWLGVTGDWLARRLGVEDRTVRRWEAGTSLIPDGVRVALEQMEAETGDAVAALVAALRDARDPAVVVYRTDEDLVAAMPDVDWPAAWWRRVVMRAALDVDGVAITYSSLTSAGVSQIAAYASTVADAVAVRGDQNSRSASGGPRAGAAAAGASI